MTSRLKTGKSVTFFYSVSYLHMKSILLYAEDNQNPAGARLLHMSVVRGLNIAVCVTVSSLYLEGHQWPPKYIKNVVAEVH